MFYVNRVILKDHVSIQIIQLFYEYFKHTLKRLMLMSYDTYLM
jgi:hypothetical protein